MSRCVDVDGAEAEYDISVSPALTHRDVHNESTSTVHVAGNNNEFLQGCLAIRYSTVYVHTYNDNNPCALPGLRRMTSGRTSCLGDIARIF